ncbi:MAG: hypothetical protein Kow00104_00470 [Rhodothalassiaceae bacterium]
MELSDRPLNDNDPTDPKRFRALMITAGIGGLALALGLAALVFLLIYRISDREESGTASLPPAPYHVRPDLPGTARTLDILPVGGRIAVEIELGPDGRLLLLLDPATGREHGRILLPPAPQEP